MISLGASILVVGLLWLYLTHRRPVPTGKLKPVGRRVRRTLQVLITSLTVLLVSCYSLFGPVSTIHGIAVTDQLNRRAQRIDEGALSRAVERVNREGRYVPILIDHNYVKGAVIGHVTHLWVQDGKMHFEAEIVETPEVLDVNKILTIQQIGERGLAAVSVGFHGMAEGNVFREIDLVEISLVPAGADGGAKVIEYRGIARTWYDRASKLIKKIFN